MENEELHAEELPKRPKRLPGMPPEQAGEEQSIADWLRQLAPDGSVKVRVSRTEPRYHNGKKMAGILGWHQEMITDEMVKELYGGGTFKLQVQTPNAKGAYVYRAQRTIEIVGTPKMPAELEPLDDPELSAPMRQPEQPDLARHALMTMERITQDERKRAERMEEAVRERPTGIDTALLETISAPLRDQVRVQSEELRELRRSLDDKETRLIESMRPKEDSVQGRLLEKMIAGDSARIDALRIQHESELRQMREFSREEVKRAEDKLQRLVEIQEKAHERETASLRMGYESQLKNLEISYTAQIRNLESQIGNLQADLGAAKAELAALRAQRETPLEEQVTRLSALKDLLGGLGGGGEEKEEPAWLQAMSAVLGSDIVKNVGQRIASAPGSTPAQPPKLNEQQRLLLLARRRAAMQQQRAQLQAQQQAQPPEGQVEVQPMKIKINPTDLAPAIQFIETAVRNDTDPTNFAQTVRAFVPVSIIEALRTDGVDALLSQVQLQTDSPLNTQFGRNFLTKVAQILAGHKG